MASPLAYSIDHKPNDVTMYDDSIAIQKASRDLVIYSAHAKQIVWVAWFVCFF